MSADSQPRYLCWADLETTGLDPQTDDVLEIYFQLTEFHAPFRPVSSDSSGHCLISGRGRDRVLAGECNPFVTKMHDKSGLRVALEDADDTLRTLGEVENILLSLSKDWPGVGVDGTTLPDKERHAVTDSKVVIAGNSAHFDLAFLRVHLPRFAARLSHRIFDVSALSLFARSLGMPRLPKSERHRAQADVENSILQARIVSNWLDAPSDSRRRNPWTDEEYGFARKNWHSALYGKTRFDGSR